MRPPKPGRHDAVGERLAHQELLRALAGLVVVVDDVVVGRLVAVELPRLAAGRQRREQDVALAVVAGVLVLAGIQDLERIAGLHLALEVDVVGVDADEVVDHRPRHLVAQARSRRCSDRAARPCRRPPRRRRTSTPRCWRCARRRRRICPCPTTPPSPRRWCRWRRRRGPAAAAWRRRPARAERAACSRPSGCCPCRAPNAAVIALHLVRGGAELAQDRGDGIALLEHDGAFVPGIAAGRLRGGLGQQGDVFRHDARLETGIGIAMPLGRIGHRPEWNR